MWQFVVLVMFRFFGGVSSLHYVALVTGYLPHIGVPPCVEQTGGFHCYSVPVHICAGTVFRLVLSLCHALHPHPPPPHPPLLLLPWGVIKHLWTLLLLLWGVIQHLWTLLLLPWGVIQHLWTLQLYDCSCDLFLRRVNYSCEGVCSITAVKVQACSIVHICWLALCLLLMYSLIRPEWTGASPVPCSYC